MVYNLYGPFDKLRDRMRCFAICTGPSTSSGTVWDALLFGGPFDKLRDRMGCFAIW